MVTIVTRASKGEALTHDEVDANFNNLNSGKEPSIASGTNAQYLRGDKSWRDFFTDVRAATLSGLSTTTNAVVSATDTVLGAIGKLQKQVTDNLSTLTSHTSNTSNPHGVTKAQVGLGNVDNTSDANKPVSTAQQAAIDAKESLLSLSQSIHSGAIVKSFFYDTSKDSDGGAWRKRCQDKSWYNEAIVPGKWFGYQPSTPAAYAAGARVGDYYQHVDGVFYQITAIVESPFSMSLTPVYRGNSREFPVQAAIIAESGRVIIYDLTQSNCPMWMVFSDVGGSMIRLSGGGSSATALNGQLMVGSISNGLQAVSFIADAAWRINSAAYSTILGNVAQRNQSLNTTSDATRKLPSSVVNDVAATVLPDAPIDPTCLVGESEVLLADGKTVRIDQVEVGTLVKTLEGVGVVTNWYDQGVKETIALEFDNGYKLQCTHDHKIRTTVGWVEAGSLTEYHEVIGV